MAAGSSSATLMPEPFHPWSQNRTAWTCSAGGVQVSMPRGSAATAKHSATEASSVARAPFQVPRKTRRDLLRSMEAM